MSETLGDVDSMILGALMVGLAYFLKWKARRRYRKSQKKPEDVLAFCQTEQRLFFLFPAGGVIVAMDVVLFIIFRNS